MSRKEIKRLAAGLACLLLSAAALLTMRAFAGRFASQYAAERWRAKGRRFAQVSCFIGSKESCDYTDVLNIADKIDDALLADATEANWLLSYSAETSVSVKSGSETVKARAICTGGDFFLIHPLEMIDGWYYQDGDINGESVVLDMRLAWSLFGGYGLTGMSVEIDGFECPIAGVSRLPAREPEKTSYGEEPTVYIPYSLLYKIDKERDIGCLEAVLPNPVSGYGLSLLEESAGFAEGSCELVENTGRFSLLNTLKAAARFGRRVESAAGVAYPYWENEARNVQSRCQLIAAAAVLLALYPLLLVIMYFIRLVKYLKNRRSKKCQKA